MERTRRFLPKLPIQLLLVLPALVYVTVAAYWQARHIYQITGDEPHYLLITDSLVTDHDLKVENNYQADTPVQRAIGMKLYVPEQMPWHVQHQYSRHNAGLPLLLVLPYWLAGVAGTKIFMALLAGLWPLLLYKVLLHITESETWSVLVAFTLAVGLPFTAASTQIFPDLLGGMIILYVALKIFGRFSGRYGEAFSLAINLWLGALIGFLPWLHIKLIAPALLLTGAHLYVEARSSRAQARPLRRHLGAAAASLCFFALLLVYNRIAFGSFFGSYANDSVHPNLKDDLMIFFGLHWDQSQGMFMQQPLLILGLVGVVPLARANRRGAVLLGLLYLSVLLPNAAHPAWYGGFTFAGRFFWTVVALWVFPLAFAVKFLLDRKRLLLQLLCAASLLLQGWYATKWLFSDGFLFNQRFAVWTSRSFYEDTGLLFLLPTFKDFGIYLRHPANYVAVLLGLLLIISGGVWRRGRNSLLTRVWGAFLVLGVTVILLVPVPNGSLAFKGYELPYNVGGLEGESRIATEKDGPGALSFGPYVKLLAGLYEAKLEYESSGTDEHVAARFDVAYSPGVKTIADGELPPSAANQGIFKYRFPVLRSQSLDATFEFRVWYLGKGTLKVKSLTITPVSFD